jgi:hypothetical protein
MTVFGGRHVTVVLAAVAMAVVAGFALLGFAAQPRAQTAPSPPSCSPGTLVQTRSGPVCGVTADGDTSYLDIPYAAPPSRQAALEVTPAGAAVDDHPPDHPAWPGVPLTRLSRGLAAAGRDKRRLSHFDGSNTGRRSARGEPAGDV